MAKTGHEFYATENWKAWDPGVRPIPANWHIVDSHEGMKFDVVLVSHAWDLGEKFRGVDAAMIFSIIADCSEGIFPERIEERISAVCFLAKEVADRWEMKDPSKKRIIEMGVDPSAFLKHTGDIRGVLTVGHRIGKRWDKGHCPFVTVGQFIPLTLAGPGNEDIKGSVGTVPHDKLMEMYSRYRVYFNPGPIIGISVVEAMLARMPVVAFRPINLCDLIVNGMNGFVVDTVDGAIMKINTLLNDPELALRMGQAARKTAEERFSIQKFCGGWNALFAEAVANRRKSVRKKLW